MLLGQCLYVLFESEMVVPRKLLKFNKRIIIYFRELSKELFRHIFKIIFKLATHQQLPTKEKYQCWILDNTLRYMHWDVALVYYRGMSRCATLQCFQRESQRLNLKPESSRMRAQTWGTKDPNQSKKRPNQSQ